MECCRAEVHHAARIHDRFPTRAKHSDLFQLANNLLRRVLRKPPRDNTFRATAPIVTCLKPNSPKKPTHTTMYWIRMHVGGCACDTRLAKLRMALPAISTNSLGHGIPDTDGHGP